MESLALVQLQHYRLAFPHRTIQAIERCSERESQISIANYQWQIVDMDDELQLRQSPFYKAPFIVCFKTIPLALRCASVENIQIERIQPLPAIMTLNGDEANSAVQGLIQYENHLVLKVDIEKLMSAAVEGSECNVMHGT